MRGILLLALLLVLVLVRVRRFSISSLSPRSCAWISTGGKLGGSWGLSVVLMGLILMVGLVGLGSVLVLGLVVSEYNYG